MCTTIFKTFYPWSDLFIVFIYPPIKIFYRLSLGILQVSLLSLQCQKETE